LATPHVKKEVKDEPKEIPAPKKDERPWWVKEMALADTARYPDDPADKPSLYVLQAKSFNEPQPMDETSALLWPTEESGVLINLTKKRRRHAAGEEGGEGRVLAAGSGSGGGG
jgi:hypothetical protein